MSCLKTSCGTDAKRSFAELIAGKLHPFSIFKRPFIIYLFNVQGHLRKILYFLQLMQGSRNSNKVIGYTEMYRLLRSQGVWQSYSFVRSCENIYSVICPFTKVGQLAETQILTNLKHIRGTCTGERAISLKKKNNLQKAQMMVTFKKVCILIWF